LRYSIYIAEEKRRTQYTLKKQGIFAMTVATSTNNIVTNTGFESFEGEEYQQELRQITPFAQIINPRMDKKGWKPFGVAIIEDNAKICGFQAPDDSWEKIEYQFSQSSSGLWITKTPRMVIVRTTDLYMKYRETGKVIGKFNAKTYGANKKAIKCFTEAFVIFLNDKNEPAHEIFTDETDGSEYVIPLKISLGGASGARVSSAFLKQTNTERSGFCVELERAFAKHKNQPKAKPMAASFHAHGVFAPTFENDEVGTPPEVNYISSVASVETPTAETLGKYLISPASRTGLLIKAAFEKYKEYQPSIGASDFEETDKSGDDGFSARTKSPTPAPTPVHPVPEPFVSDDPIPF